MTIHARPKRAGLCFNLMRQVKIDWLFWCQGPQGRQFVLLAGPRHPCYFCSLPPCEGNIHRDGAMTHTFHNCPARTSRLLGANSAVLLAMQLQITSPPPKELSNGSAFICCRRVI